MTGRPRERRAFLPGSILSPYIFWVNLPIGEEQ